MHSRYDGIRQYLKSLEEFARWIFKQDKIAWEYLHDIFMDELVRINYMKWMNYICIEEISGIKA